MKKIDEKTKEVNSYIKKNLSAGRYAHSVRVAEYSVFLASLSKKTKKLKKLAYFTGLAHDICKELSDKEQIKLAKKDGKPITDIELQKPNLLHGRAGAVFLQEKFEITDKEVLHAIENHTFGSPEFESLGKLVFIADKIEPGRKGVFVTRLRKAVAKISLDELALNIVSYNIARLRRRKLKASVATVAMKKELTNKLKNKRGQNADRKKN